MEIEVDQSVITGESLPVKFRVGDICKMGSTVTRGCASSLPFPHFHVHNPMPPRPSTVGHLLACIMRFGAALPQPNPAPSFVTRIEPYRLRCVGGREGRPPRSLTRVISLIPWVIIDTAGHH